MRDNLVSNLGPWSFDESGIAGMEWEENKIQFSLIQRNNISFDKNDLRDLLFLRVNFFENLKEKERDEIRGWKSAELII